MNHQALAVHKTRLADTPEADERFRILDLFQAQQAAVEISGHIFGAFGDRDLGLVEAQDHPPNRRASSSNSASHSFSSRPPFVSKLANEQQLETSSQGRSM